jgi:hypothetical protein
MKKIFTLFAISFSFFLLVDTGYAQQADTTVIIPFGSSWKYLDDGTDQGTAWQAGAFNDVAWKEGPGQLGYGDNDEATVVGFGGVTTARFITTYFRKTFTLADASIYKGYALKIIRDDGVILYANGVEKFLDNATTASTYTTLATATVGGTTVLENTPIPATLSQTDIVSGSNTFAVEIHQITASSSDISFDLQLSGISKFAGVTNPSAIDNVSLKVYPASFSDKATVEYKLPSSGTVQIQVYDITGKEVASIFNGIENGGAHKIDLIKKNTLQEGFYFVKLSFNEHQITQKISILD